MTTLRQEIADYRTSLDNQASKSMRYFNTAIFGFGACVVGAAVSGPNDGWHWLIGSILFQFGGLWALLEARHFRTLSAVHSIPVSIQLIAEESKGNGQN